MNNFILSAVVIAAIAGVSQAQVGCPLTGCPYILYPKECRAESYMVYHGQVCKQCDKCLDKDIPKGQDGCPVMPCPLIALSKECTAKRFFIWKGRLCHDCDANICD